MSDETSEIIGFDECGVTRLIKVGPCSKLISIELQAQPESLGKAEVLGRDRGKGIDAFHLSKQVCFFAQAGRVPEQEEIIQVRLFQELAYEPGENSQVFPDEGVLDTRLGIYAPAEYLSYHDRSKALELFVVV